MLTNALLIGKILQKYQLVSDEQYQQAVRAQEQMGGRVPLAEILLLQGLLTSEQAQWLQRAIQHYEAQSQRAQEEDSPSRAVLRVEPEQILEADVVESSEAARTPLELIPETVHGEDWLNLAFDGEPLVNPGPESEPESKPRPAPPSSAPPPERPDGRGVTAIGRVAIGAIRILDPSRRRREVHEATPEGDRRQAPAAPATPTEELHRLLQEAVRGGASDLLLGSGQVPAVRIAGELHRLAPCAGEIVDPLLSQLLGPADARRLRQHGEVTFVMSAPSGRARVTIVQKQGGWHVACRLLPPRAMALEDLGLPAVLGPICALPAGLVLCTGAAGSGKSTTLSALASHIAEHRAASILVIEDLAELAQGPGRGPGIVHALRVQENGLVPPPLALCEDGEVIIIDELRPGPALPAALSLVEAGCLVLCSVRAPSPAAALSRLLPMGSDRAALCRRLGRSLVAVTAQHLLPRADDRAGRAAVDVLLASADVAELIEADRLADLPNPDGQIRPLP